MGYQGPGGPIRAYITPSLPAFANGLNSRCSRRVEASCSGGIFFRVLTPCKRRCNHSLELKNQQCEDQHCPGQPLETACTATITVLQCSAFFKNDRAAKKKPGEGEIRLGVDNFRQPLGIRPWALV